MLFKEAKKILNAHKRDLTKLGAKTFALFGSVARNEGTSKSDIDILIDFDPKKGLFAFVNLKTTLEKILKRKVDLVTKNALHPALKDRILHEAKHVF